ncbi:abhydrolase domain-containing protein 14B [Elysia marginata]|uniref:Abhydrolase domain-containing protein 14B n=1 Tax=Elysia marginata TaxID=1093978 RepID=A0AAV4FWJ5_9GAST|nr:abhydrolase domain-containing protein 14B [Elysia marginata]
MGGLRPSGLHINKPVVFGLFGIALVVFIVTRVYMGGGLAGGVASRVFQIGSRPTVVNPSGAGRGMEPVVNASKLDALPALPPDGTLVKKEEQFKVTVAGQTLNVQVVQMMNSKTDVSNALTVFFLHGAAFSSQNWVDIKTLDHVANWGYRSIAIDLPGKGKTADTISTAHYVDFLSAFIQAMGMTKIVIVSPSMSGGYALPYLFNDPKTSTDRAVGYVPVAPVQTSAFRKQYPESQLPTLIVYGTKDSMAETVLNDLSLLPKHEAAPIEGAGHACYMNNPEAFHKVLYHFLKGLTS